MRPDPKPALPQVAGPRAAALAAALLFAAAASPFAASPESEEYRGATEARPVDTGSGTRDAAADSADTALPADGMPAGSATAPAAPRPHPVLHPVAAAPGPRPVLAILPTAAAPPPAPAFASATAPDARPGMVELETVTEALRLGAEQAGRHRLLTPEETARPFGRAAAVPRDCFAEDCARRAARKLGTDFLLLSEYAGTAPARPGPAVISLVLLDARTGRVVRAVRARACAGSPGPIPFAQQAVWHLLLPADSGVPAPGTVPVTEEPGRACKMADGMGEVVADVAADSGTWSRIPWLHPPATADNRMRWAATGAGALAAGLGLAWVQGQLLPGLQDDPNSAAPVGPLIGADGARSWMRGFFATPNPGARFAAMGGAGIAQGGDALAVVRNPAALADAGHETVAAARRNLPGEVPSFHLSYAGPLQGGWYQGLAIQHEGDDLANETSLHAGLAGDFGSVSRPLSGLLGGAAFKVYLAKVGSGGAGMDRSTGHSAGAGLDLGIKLRLSPRIAAAATVRDAVGFLRHSNTFTNRAYWELLPPEYRLGAAYQVDPTFLLALDGQKGMVADQTDHVRLGAEKSVFRFLALRAGLHQAFGRQAVRKLSAGFGIDSEGLSDRPLRGKVCLSYAYDFGLDEDEPLGTGQSFSLEVSW